MKRSFFLSLQFVVLILIVFSCSDKVVQEPTYSPPPSPPHTPPSPERILRVDAGIDQVIFLPLSGTQFTASAFDKKYLTNLQYEWKKIKGPDNYKMDDPTKVNPMLSNLGQDLYEFAFSATAPDGKFDSDTVKIQVAQSTGEFVIPKLAWSCPMGCGLLMQVKIRKDKSVRIYIKPEGSASNWVEASKVFPAAPPYPVFYYGISDDDSLWIHADDQMGYCDVKIVFQ